MAKEILVPIKGKEGIEDIIPYIERVVQPGTKVIFVIPCQSGSSLEMNPYHEADAVREPAHFAA
jgi:hypothetical protein